MKFITSLVSQHLTRYPDLELQDVYKLLCQSAMGASRSTESIDVLHDKFKRELKHTSVSRSEPVIDPISPDGLTSRVHLKTYVSLNYPTDDLFQAFIETIQLHQGSSAKLKKFVSCLRDLSSAGQLPFKREDTTEFLDKIEMNNYPVVGHSDLFKTQYSPSYRIVHMDFLANEELMGLSQPRNNSNMSSD